VQVDSFTVLGTGKTDYTKVQKMVEDADIRLGSA
jgi:hypothetical protein